MFVDYTVWRNEKKIAILLKVHRRARMHARSNIYLLNSFIHVSPFDIWEQKQEKLNYNRKIAHKLCEQRLHFLSFSASTFSKFVVVLPTEWNFIRLCQ